MGTFRSLAAGSREIGERTAEYLGITVFGTAAFFAVFSLFSVLSLGATKFILEKEFHGMYFAVLTLFGLSFYASQTLAGGEWKSESDEEVPKEMMIVIAFSYYNLIVMTGTLLGVTAFALGYPLIGVGLALLAGPIDLELAQDFNGSPITYVVGMIVAIAIVIGWVANHGSREAQPRVIASILTGERFRRGRGGLLN